MLPFIVFEIITGWEFINLLVTENCVIEKSTISLIFEDGQICIQVFKENQLPGVYIYLF